jgi:pyruvate kinase
LPAGERSAPVMVTMPSEAATGPALVRDLLAAGMDVMRINCALDNPGAWAAMVNNLQSKRRAMVRRLSNSELR